MFEIPQQQQQPLGAPPVQPSPLAAAILAHGVQPPAPGPGIAGAMPTLSDMLRLRDLMNSKPQNPQANPLEGLSGLLPGGMGSPPPGAGMFGNTVPGTGSLGTSVGGTSYATGAAPGPMQFQPM